MVVGVCDKARGMSGQQAAVKLPWVKRVTREEAGTFNPNPGETRTLHQHCAKCTGQFTAPGHAGTAESTESLTNFGAGSSWSHHSSTMGRELDPDNKTNLHWMSQACRESFFFFFAPA